MPRRRLFGETQKRRKKERTRVLKRQSTVSRSRTTQLPAPFERSAQLDGPDITFLEAMRQMQVERIPGSMEAPARRELFRRLQVAAEKKDEAMFMETMAELGVRPLPSERAKKGPSARNPRKKAGGKPESAGEGASAKQPQPGKGAAAQTPLERAEGKRTAIPPATEEPRSLPSSRSGGGTRILPVTPTRFAADSGDADLLQAVMEGRAFDPSEKYQGAPPPRKQRADPVPPENLEPDDELDLHRKTREEAIGMVQNFLLTSFRRKYSHVLIITGKGKGSGEAGAVLNEAVNGWLRRNGDRFARAFFPAPPRHGGTGAIWVIMR